MDFFTIVIILAIVVLIVLLTYIGVSMSKLETSQVFPPNANVCPDYWTEVEPGKCMFPAAGTRNTGDFTNPKSYTSAKTPAVTGQTYLVGSGSPVGQVYGDGSRLGETTQIKEVIDVNESAWNTAYDGMSSKCAKKKWSTAHGVAWDGISNTNSCA